MYCPYSRLNVTTGAEAQQGATRPQFVIAHTTYARASGQVTRLARRFVVWISYGGQRQMQ